MNKFQKLMELNKEFNGALISDNSDAVWYTEDDYYYYYCWNGEGYTYSGGYRGNYSYFDDDTYLLIELNNDYGTTYFNLFLKSNEQKETK